MWIHSTSFYDAEVVLQIMGNMCRIANTDSNHNVYATIDTSKKKCVQCFANICWYRKNVKFEMKNVPCVSKTSFRWISVGENGIPTIMVSAHPFKRCQEPKKSHWKQNWRSKPNVGRSVFTILQCNFGMVTLTFCSSMLAILIYTLWKVHSAGVKKTLWNVHLIIPLPCS
jgi:hypothetical protein